ncbi:MAG: hypothetical protein CMJ78_17650 [Planctomycetaceae bacterium]|nr:hypothetical protein [Planctomycetaceae bacterium]
MTMAVAALGLMIVIPCAFRMIVPDLLRAIVIRLNMQRRYLFTVAARATFGAVWLAAPPQCRYSTGVFVFGVLMLAAAIIVLAMGPTRFSNFVERAIDFPMPTTLMRLWMASGVGIGWFLIYGSGVV